MLTIPESYPTSQKLAVADAEKNEPAFRFAIVPLAMIPLAPYAPFGIASAPTARLILAEWSRQTTVTVGVPTALVSGNMMSTAPPLVRISIDDVCRFSEPVRSTVNGLWIGVTIILMVVMFFVYLQK